MKECSACKRNLAPKEFQARSPYICTVCSKRNHEARISNTYRSYLTNLFNQSRSKNRTSRNLEWLITVDDLVALWEKQEGRCAISGVFLTHHKDGLGHKEYNVSIDRIQNARGYTPQNTQLVCFRANRLKGELPEDMFYWWVKTINNFSCD